MTSKNRALAPRRPRKARTSLFLALAAGLVTAVLIPARFGAALRLVAAWDATAVVMGGLAWWFIGRLSASETRARAAEDDPGRAAVWVFVLAASALSLFTTSVVLREARTRAPDARDIFIACCLLAVATSWALTHTAYRLRYAHLYYSGDRKGEGGLDFPGSEPPCYFDFAYFAFTVGMCFQVSDVVINSGKIRRVVLSQALLSFVYNTVILAVALNIVLGLFG